MTGTQGPSSIPGDVFLIAVSQRERDRLKIVTLNTYTYTHTNHAASACVYAVLIQAH